MESLTTTELLESWDISLRSQGKSGRTIESYYLAVTQLDAHVGGKPPAEIARTDIEGFLAQVLATRASATARQRYASLKQFFKWLEEENEIPSNPMEKMKPPKVVEKPVPVLTTDEIRRLLAACKAGPPFEAARDTALILMFLDTGVRLGEMIGLKQTDLDLKLQVAVVTGKGSKLRTVPYGRTAAAALDRYRRRRRGHKFSDSAAFWIGQKGDLTGSGIAQLLVRRCRDADLERIHPHQFRHTFAHRWLTAGGNEGDLQRIAGWSSGQMIERYGASAADERAREAYRRIDMYEDL